MLPIFDSLRDIDFITVLVRMLLVCLLSGAIGMERSIKNRPAGFRTHILVGIGAATASMAGHYMYLNMEMSSDLTRIGAQVISGLGFIGAGTIIVTKKGAIKGLTTAAGLWTTGIVGLAVGAGFYEGGIVATLLILFAETVLARVGKRIPSLPEFNIFVNYSKKSALDELMRYCKDHNIAIVDLKIESDNRSADGPTYMATVQLRSIRSVEPEVLAEQLRTLKGIDEVDLATDL